MKFDFFRKTRRKLATDAAEDFGLAIIEQKKVETNKWIYYGIIALDVLSTIPALVSVFGAGSGVPAAIGAVPQAANNFTLYIDKVVIKN